MVGLMNYYRSSVTSYRFRFVGNLRMGVARKRSRKMARWYYKEVIVTTGKMDDTQGYSKKEKDMKMWSNKEKTKPLPV